MKKVLKRNNTMLTVEKVLLIKAVLKAGGNQTRLAKAIGVSRATINRIATGATWSDI